MKWNSLLRLAASGNYMLNSFGPKERNGVRTRELLTDVMGFWGCHGTSQFSRFPGLKFLETLPGPPTQEAKQQQPQEI